MEEDQKQPDNKETDKEINFSKKKVIYGSNEYGRASSELCRSNENEYGRTDYDERARKELIRRSRNKNVMSSNTGKETNVVKPANSIVVKLSREEVKGELTNRNEKSVDMS